MYHNLVRGVLALALLLPLSIASMQPAYGGSSLLCGPMQHASPAAVKAAAEISQLLGLTPPEPPKTDHCDQCVLIIGLAPNSAFTKRQFKTRANIYAARRLAGFAYHAHGPPLGARAPPVFI